ncbi:hypothetical protein HPB52_023968 [Rhipicephalus sanguineus]|uniref:Uncharacterized protein n=1 Tax=Rhipicephalus sanguineus TaxID=34632 RepID=A0A9D4T4T4_RHISA|nr:hypothetical protein HPB52_023968 [Rhipicephalus sanguineus]
MATFTYSEHDLVQCPYDPDHKAEARKPLGAQAASPRTVLNDVNWPSCAQACQAQTGHAPTRKPWVQKAAHTTNSQPRSTQANQPCSTKANQSRSTQVSQPRSTQPSHSRGTQARQPRGAQAQTSNPWAVHAAQSNQRLGDQTSPTPGRTWDDLFRNTTVSTRSTDMNELAERVKELGFAGPKGK